MKAIFLVALMSATCLFASAQTTTKNVSADTNSAAVESQPKESTTYAGHQLFRNALGWYSDSWYNLADPAKYPTLWLSAKGGMKFFASTTIAPVMTIAKDGNIGIGTDVPTQRLHVVNGNILITRSSTLTRAPGSVNGSIMFGAATSTDDIYGEWGIEYLDDPVNPGLNFWKVNRGHFNYALFIRNDGNIGIGTSTPKYKLDVIGGIRAQSLVIDMNGIPSADFVFKPEYKLMPLSEVEEFITENGHLPEIPSESDLQQTGMNVQEFQVKLLQKIEELTLHIIDQDKTIKELTEKVRSLEK